MGNKKLAINLIANTISYSTTALIAFLLTPYLVSTIGKEAYSFYPLANNFVTYMGIITVSLNSMASRFITIEIVKNNKLKANQYFVSVLYSNIAMSLILMIPMTLIIVFIDSFLNIPVNLENSVRILFVFVFLSMIVNVITAVFGVAVFVRNKLEFKSISEIFVGVLRVVLYIVLFKYFDPDIFYVGLVALIISITLFFFNFTFTKKLLPELVISKQFYKFKLIKVIFTSGIWNSLNQIGSILLTSLSLLIINIYLGSSEAGVYAIALTIPSLINGVITMLSVVFIPSLTHKFAQGNKAILISEVIKSQKIMGIFTNIPIAIFFAIGIEFFVLWMPQENHTQLYWLSMILSGHLMITGVIWPIYNLNTILNKIKIPSLYTLFSGVINVLLVFIMMNIVSRTIFIFAIIGLVINLFTVCFFIPIYSAHILNISKRTFYPIIFKTLLGGFIITILTYCVKELVVIESWPSLIIITVISSTIGIVINALIILRIDGIRKIIKNIRK